MPNDYLSYLQEINEGFIHPKGISATKLLLKHLAPANGDKILELGVGTGTSLVMLLSLNNNIKLYGVDLNENMLIKAAKRLKFCGFEKKVELKLLNKNKSIPFDNDFFDKIYIESVLGIQENDDLPLMIKELGRVLKPNGKLILNELIWASRVSITEATDINNIIKKNFGIIQANAKYPYLKNWNDILSENNFLIEHTENLAAISNNNSNKKCIAEKKSEVFSKLGKLKSRLKHRMVKQKKTFDLQLNRLDLRDKVEAYLILAINNKTN